MFTHTRHRRALAVGGVFFAVAIVASGVIFWLSRDTGNVSPGSPPPASAAVMTVDVYFHRGQGSDPADVVAVKRIVPSAPRVAEAALAALLTGPTEGELAEGYWSHFSAATAGRLNFARVANDVAHADFRDFSRVIPNASSSAGSAALLAELDATVSQSDKVAATVYSFDGDVAAFYEWLQMVPPNKMQPGPAEARQAAVKFAAGVIGLEKPTDEGFRMVSSTGAEVDIYSWIWDGVTSHRGPLTIVSLRRDVKAWTVTGARTGDIRVTAPSPAQAISSPLTVKGEALAWEGMVNTRVLQVKNGKVTELGRGNVLGGGDIPRSFAGTVSFTKPGAASGWVVFTSASGHNGETIAATAVPVAFTGITAPPQVVDLRMVPDVAIRDGWVSLYGADTVTFVVRAKGTNRVRFLLNPVGSRNTPSVIELGVATRNGDEFTFVWRYPDEPLLAHLSVVLSGPGGSTEHLPFGLYHP